MSTMDEAASTTDGLGCVDPDGAPGAEPLVKSSPVTAAAAAAAAGVEVVSAPNREGSRDRLKQSQREAKHTRLKALRRRIKSKHNVWNKMNGYVRAYLRFWGRDFANCSDSVSLFKHIFEAVPHHFGT